MMQENKHPNHSSTHHNKIVSTKKMEGEESPVKLHGMWLSPFAKRTEIALKIKGVMFEYVEEDLTNKSQLLLQYNPVHKKVPVLVHNGKPIVESLVILEYIDETWTHAPRFLPQDPYERARVRFWAGFLHQQMFESIMNLLKCNEEEQEIAEKELHERIKLLEEGLQDFDPDKMVSPDSDLWMLNILIITLFSPYEAMEEAVGTKILDPERYPKIYSWVSNINKHPMAIESRPPHEKLVELFKIFKFPEKTRALFSNYKPVRFGPA